MRTRGIARELRRQTGWLKNQSASMSLGVGAWMKGAGAETVFATKKVAACTRRTTVAG